MNKKKWIRWIGFAVLLISLIFIVRKIRSYSIDLRSLLSVSTIVQLLIFSAIYGACNFSNAACYQYLYCQFCGKNIPWRRIMRVYLQSNLYRYIPGNILHYIGRNQLAAEYNVPHFAVAGITVLEIVILTVVSTLTAICFTVRQTASMLAQLPLWSILVAAGVLVIGCILLFKLGYPQRFIKRYFVSFNRGCIKPVALSCVIRCILFIIYGWIFSQMLNMAGAVQSTVPLTQIIGTYALCWFVGFVTPGAPGGLGVREAMLLYFFEPFFPGETVLNAAILMRMTTVFGDILSFLLSLILLRNGADSKG